MKRIAIGLVMALAAGMLRGEGELPDGYTKIEGAVEVPSGAYVDTGYKPNQNTHVEMKVAVKSKTEYWFGCWTNDYNVGAFALCNDGDLGVYFALGDDGGSVSNAVADGVHTIEIKDWQMLVDGTNRATKAESSRVDFQLDCNLYLFAQNRAGTTYIPPEQESIFCHYCKISEGETVKCDFVPCKRNVDDVEGFYDTVSGRFFFMKRPQVSLPKDYTALEYIRVSPKAYVDTGCKPNQDTRVLMDVAVERPVEYWFGVWDNAEDFSKGAYSLCNNGNYVFFAVGSVGGNYIRASTGAGVSPGRHTVEIAGLMSKFDGATSHDWSKEVGKEGFQLENSLYLFAHNRAGTAFTDGGGDVVCYGCTIVDGKGRTYRLVPCIRTSDGTSGLYDTTPETTGEKFYPVIDNTDSGVKDWALYYKTNHVFTSKTFVEFNRWESDQLCGFLQAANARMNENDYGVKCGRYAYINVRIVLRNPRSEDWVLPKDAVTSLRMRPWEAAATTPASSSRPIRTTSLLRRRILGRRLRTPSVRLTWTAGRSSSPPTSTRR